MKARERPWLNALLIVPLAVAYFVVLLATMAGAPAFYSMKYLRERRYAAAFAGVFAWYVVPLGVVAFGFWRYGR